MKTTHNALFLGLFFLFWGCKDPSPSKAKAELETTPISISQHEAYLLEISKLPRKKHATLTSGMIKIEGGSFEMGGVSSQSRADELPRHPETVAPFWMDRTEVTNAQFAEFVAATGYITTAEREAVIEGQTYPPGALVFNPSTPQSWWKFELGANWKHPYGTESTIVGKEDHPVVQVSWYDAMAYAHWMGKRLPTEVEWEYAARAGQNGHKYFWGNDFLKATAYANFHQGNFPVENQLEDRFEKTASVGSFPANSHGLLDLAGNVWEWCLDTYHPNAYERLDKREDGYFASYTHPKQEKVIRGGSFLCNESYCTGYRLSARMSSTPDTGLEHTGFRLVYSE